MTERTDRLDHYSERVAKFCAGLATIISRLQRNEPAVPLLTCVPNDTETSNEIERALHSLLVIDNAEQSDAQSKAQSFMPPPQSDVVDGMIETVAQLVRGSSWESEFWMYVLRSCPCVIPSRLVEDLIARDIEVVMLGHLSLRDRDLWNLFEVDEAALTLAIRRYLYTDYDCYDFEEVVSNCVNRSWVIQTLASYQASDRKKLLVLANIVHESTESEVLLNRADPDLRHEVMRLRSS